MATNNKKRLNAASYTLNILFIFPLLALSNFLWRGESSHVVAIEFIGGAAVISGIVCYILAFVWSVRRLHDLGRRGWWSILFLPPFTILFVPYLCLTSGESESNRYGDATKGIRMFGIRAKGGWRITGIVLIALFVVYLCTLYLTFMFG